jgi:hypothetical protein
MALEQKFRVKISSEAAGYVALTPVVVQEMDLLELLEHIAAQTGGEPERTAAVLRRGSTVSGASRLRWQPPQATADELSAAVALLPQAEPQRALAWPRCVRVGVSGEGRRDEIDRETGQRRRWFRSCSCWDELALVVSAGAPAYAGYLYRERADHYRLRLDPAARAAVQRACALLRQRMRVLQPELLDLIVPR